MIPQGSHEQMEPPESDADRECECCNAVVTDDDELCSDCQREADEMNGIYDNGTEETVKIALPKFKTTDGRGACSLDIFHDHLTCPMMRLTTLPISCAWTGSQVFTDNPDGSGYVRPCENCPIHKQ